MGFKTLSTDSVKKKESLIIILISLYIYFYLFEVLFLIDDKKFTIYIFKTKLIIYTIC